MSSRPHPESVRPLCGPLQSFDLATEIARLREEKAWQEGRRNAITLRKGEGLNVVLLVMREGDRLDEHSAPGPMTLSVHEGRIRFSAADEEVEAGAGILLACDAGVRHSVEAVGDAVCLLNVVTGSERRGFSQPEGSVNFNAVAATADNRAGAIWTQKVSCDLNADLVRSVPGAASKST